MPESEPESTVSVYFGHVTQYKGAEEVRIPAAHFAHREGSGQVRQYSDVLVVDLPAHRPIILTPDTAYALKVTFEKFLTSEVPPNRLTDDYEG